MVQVLMLEAISFLFVGIIVGTGSDARALPPIVAKYFMLSSVATAFNLFGAALLFREIGSLAYVDIYKFVRELSSHSAAAGGDNYVKFVIFVSFACLFAKISLGLKVFPFSQIVPEIGSALNYFGLYLYTVVFTFPYIIAFANICKIGIVGSADASFVYMTILFSLTLIFGAAGLSSYPSALKVYFSYSAVFSGATVSIIMFCSIFNHGMVAAAFFYYFTAGLATAAVFGYLVSLTTMRGGVVLREVEFVTQLRFVREYFAAGGLTFAQKFTPFLGLVMAAGLPPFPIFFIKISYYAVLIKHDFYILLILSVVLSVFLVFYNYRLAAIIIEESCKKEDSFASRSFGADYHLYDHCKISRIV
jgi:NADH:ubiquinone oxidoreductase subunit 2 (subunit N)